MTGIIQTKDAHNVLQTLSFFFSTKLTYSGTLVYNLHYSLQIYFEIGVKFLVYHQTNENKNKNGLNVSKIKREWKGILRGLFNDDKGACGWSLNVII